MIDVIFNSDIRNTSAVSGAYQYDTGQRMRLIGLPSPEEFAQQDELLSGDGVSMMVQFAYVGDSQTESRLASYDEATRAWMVDVPDEYLYRHAAVDVYIYIGYGYTSETVEETTIAKTRNVTAYTASYVPVGRAAPGDMVTPEQISSWNALVTEVNLAIGKTNAATEAAQEATAEMLTLQSQWENADVIANTLEPDEPATVTLTENADHTKKVLTYGIPRGQTGEKGDKGDKGDKGEDGEKGDTGPAGVTFSLQGTTLYITIDP